MEVRKKWLQLNNIVISVNALQTVQEYNIRNPRQYHKILP